jgi:translation elongation factor EF-G
LEKHGVGSSGTSRKWPLTLVTPSISFNLTLREGPKEYTEEAIDAFFDSIDGVVVVFDACRDVEPKHARALLRPAKRHKMPIVVFVTAMDLLDADFLKVVGRIDAVLGGKPVPTQLPMGAEGNFCGIVDLIRMRSSSGVDNDMIDDLELDVPEEMPAPAKEWRSKLEEAAAAASDAFMEMFGGGEEFSTLQLISAIRQLTLAKSIMPVLVGTTSPDTGIEALLNAVCEFLPSPKDAAPKPSPKRKLPFFLTAKLTATDPKELENLRTSVTTLARDGRFSVAVKEDLHTIDIMASDPSHIQDLIDELRQIPTLSFSASPTQVLKFEYPTHPVNNAEGKHETDEHYAHVVIDLYNFDYEEEEAGKCDHPHLRFEDADTKKSIPIGFVSTCEHAFGEACRAGGPLTGSPITRMGMRLRSGSHGGDKLSAEYFHQATTAAVTKAFAEMKWAVLEPVVRVEVEIPVDCVLGALADLGRRRAKIEGQETVGDGVMRVTALCPAEEAFDYESELRGLSGGRGRVEMEYVGYETVAR